MAHYGHAHSEVYTIIIIVVVVVKFPYLVSKVRG